MPMYRSCNFSTASIPAGGRWSNADPDQSVASADGTFVPLPGAARSVADRGHNGKTFRLGQLHELCSLPRAASLDEANRTRPKKCTVGIILPINNHQIEPAVGPVVTDARYIKPRPELCRNILVELIEAEAVRLDAEDVDLGTRPQKHISDGADAAAKLKHLFRAIFPHDGGETSQGAPRSNVIRPRALSEALIHAKCQDPIGRLGKTPHAERLPCLAYTRLT
jgi:hypothetical protein